jgi:hypothetical protein
VDNDTVPFFPVNIQLFGQDYPAAFPAPAPALVPRNFRTVLSTPYGEQNLLLRAVARLVSADKTFQSPAGNKTFCYTRATVYAADHAQLSPPLRGTETVVTFFQHMLISKIISFNPLREIKSIITASDSRALFSTPYGE